MGHLEKNEISDLKCMKMISNRPEEYFFKHLKFLECMKIISNRPEEYSFFKHLTFLESKYEALKNPEIWPEGVRINNFLFRQIKSKMKD